jgi:hypothetical protein
MSLSVLYISPCVPGFQVVDCIGGVMISLLASCAVDRGVVIAQVSHNKCYKIGICCFSVKHAALRSKSKDWLAMNQNNVSE